MILSLIEYWYGRRSTLISRVLVADNEPQIVNILREFLTVKNCEVLTAFVGAGAFRKVSVRGST